MRWKGLALFGSCFIIGFFIAFCIHSSSALARPLHYKQGSDLCLDPAFPCYRGGDSGGMSDGMNSPRCYDCVTVCVNAWACGFQCKADVAVGYDEPCYSDATDGSCVVNGSACYK